jgi:diacylglycerol kinase family enzyme
MRVIVLLNTKAGAAATRDLDLDRAASLRESFQAEGVAAEVRLVHGHEIVEAARSALAQRPDAVVAAGGDGTVSGVAGVLAGTQTPLGILPLGTLNHFAKDVGMPASADECIGVIAAGHVREVDIAQVNGRAFVNNSSIGIYPQVVRHREAQRERLGRGRWLAMFLAVINALRRFPVVRVRLGVEGRTVLRTTPFVFIGNNEYEMSLFTVRGRKALDCGRLSLYVANRTGRFGMFRLALRALVSRLDQAKDFDSALLPELWVETGKRHLYVALDGEVEMMKPPLHYRSVPRGLRVIVPRAS